MRVGQMILLIDVATGQYQSWYPGCCTVNVMSLHTHEDIDVWGFDSPPTADEAISFAKKRFERGYGFEPDSCLPLAA